MPPTGMNFSNLSDEELAQMLRDYNIDVGPINVATRSTYERKLHKLKTGEISPPTHKYAPVDDDDDDDDEEVELRLPTTSTPSGRGTPSSIPVPTQVRSRREVLDQSSIHQDYSRPSLGSSKSILRDVRSGRSDPKDLPIQVEAESKGIPLWVKLIALCAVIVLGYLIYSNMEPQAVNLIPSMPNKVEV